MVDWIVVGLLAAGAVFGLIRGVVSQIMALAGLAAAYLLAPTWGPRLAGFVQGQLGCSRFMAEKASILGAGLGIYLCVRLAGYGVEKLVVKRVKAFERMNRLGGALLGAVKTAVMIAIVFFFLALMPQKTLRGAAPRVPESHAYRLASRFNPMADTKVLDRMRRLRAAVKDPRMRSRIERDRDIGELLERHRLKGVLQDDRFVRSLEEGDYERIGRSETAEKLMRDDELVDLLDKLENEPPA